MKSHLKEISPTKFMERSATRIWKLSRVILSPIWRKSFKNLPGLTWTLSLPRSMLLEILELRKPLKNVKVWNYQECQPKINGHLSFDQTCSRILIQTHIFSSIVENTIESKLEWLPSLLWHCKPSSADLFKDLHWEPGMNPLDRLLHHIYSIWETLRTCPLLFLSMNPETKAEIIISIAKPVREGIQIFQKHAHCQLYWIFQNFFGNFCSPGW